MHPLPITPRIALLTLLLAFCSLSTVAQTGGVVNGRVVDQLGGLIVGAFVKATSANGAEKISMTGADGTYMMTGLTPGKYTVSVEVEGFAPYAQANVEVAAGRRRLLDIQLSVTLKPQELTVSEQRGLSIDPDNPASSLVLRGSDLDVLSDDPDQLAEDLRAIAG